MKKTASAYSFLRFDVDSDSYVYGKIIGTFGRAVDPAPISAQGKIQTSGSSVTVTATDAANTAPFAEVAVGDIIVVDRGTGVTDVRAVATRTDADNITVDTAVNWSGGFTFSYYKAVTGTAATVGWIDVSGADEVLVTVKWEQGDLATSLDYIVQGRDNSLNPQPIDLQAASILLADVGTSDDGRVFHVLTEGFSAIRVGLKRTGADTSDAGAAVEIVDVALLISSSTP